MIARAIFWLILLCNCLVITSPLYSAEAQPNEVVIGPVEYQQDVNGVPITITVTSYFKIDTVENKLFLKARIVADLIDLQQKIGSIVDSFDLPKDNCKSYSPNNPVVAIPRKELRFQNGGALFSIGATVTMWECLENPIPNSKVEWELRNVGFGIRTRVPVIKTWPGDPIKTKLVTQPIDADLPVYLIKINDHAVGIQFSKPDIQLNGQYAFITNGVLKIAGIDINDKAYNALQKAIDPQKLQLAIPDEYKKFNPSVEAARFFDDAGHLSAEIDLNALVPGAAVTDFVKAILEKRQ